jgi:hypothetical protein
MKEKICNNGKDHRTVQKNRIFYKKHATSNRFLSKQRYSEEFLGITGATTKLPEE